MSEIVFRGKRLDNGEWAYGCPVKCDKGVYRGRFYVLPAVEYVSFKNGSYCIGGFVEVEPSTTGQYTGLTDKNGVKIFQGDFLLLGDEKTPVYVEFMDSLSWRCTCKAFGPHYCYRLMRLGHEPEYHDVIGNIHDNPELLEGGSGNG